MYIDVELYRIFDLIPLKVVFAVGTGFADIFNQVEAATGFRVKFYFNENLTNQVSALSVITGNTSLYGVLYQSDDVNVGGDNTDNPDAGPGMTAGGFWAAYWYWFALGGGLLVGITVIVLIRKLR
jgi:hypothetical protein